jgi:serine/threonine protein kinase
MAIGVGLIERRAAGFGGPVIVDINRLVDSAALRSALSGEPAADLAVALSDQAYTLIIQPGYPGIPAGQFAHANVVAKEFSGTAWIWLSARQWSEPAYLPLGPADPREVAGYRIVARLGSGQAGPVYLASSGSSSGSSGGSGSSLTGGFSGGGLGDAAPGWAALKVFDQRLVADPAVRRRLSLGAIAARVAREPHVASLVDSDVGEDQDYPWVASTLVRGPSLAAVVAETGRLPADTAGWIALGLARALTTLHDSGFTHDAVSPRNVVLDAHGPVLTDLGISRTTLISGPGTPGNDVLMLGATVFFATVGRSPWGDGSARTVTAALPRAVDLRGDPNLAGCPSLLAPIVGACLAADPAARPAAAKLHAWLAAEIGQQPPSWLPGPVAARVTEYRALPPSRGRFRWSRGRDQ